MALHYPLEKRGLDILKMIIYANGPVSIRAITEQIGISRRSVYYDLEKIDDWLKANSLEPLIRDRSKGISVSKEEEYRIQQMLFSDNDQGMRIFTPLERERLIICTIILCSRPVYMEDFMEWCGVSRNTTVNDLKNVSSLLEKNHLKLRYIVKEGYRITGDPIRAMALFCLYFPQFQQYFADYILSSQQMEYVEEYHLRLKKIESRLQAEYVYGILPSLAVLTASLVNRRAAGHIKDDFSFSDADRTAVTGTPEYRMVEEQFPELIPNDRLYLSLHLLGSRFQTVDIMEEKDDGYAAEIARKLINSFEEITGISCGTNVDLWKALTAHMKTSLYRYRYGIQLGNPMLDQIRQQYKEVFELTKAAFLRISDENQLHVSDAEIAYLALHFGGYINMKRQQTRTYSIMVICPNGVGTSNMIRQEILRLIPNVEKVEVRPLRDYHPDEAFDVIVSTVPIPNEPRLINVNPILTDLDKIALLRRCMQTGPSASTQIEQILEIGRKYIRSDSFDAFSQDIHNYFRSLGNPELPKENYGFGLMSFLTASHIQYIGKSMDWEEAIRLSCYPLLIDDSITEHYVDAIVTAQREKQHYMFLMEGLVLAHAQTEEGVKKVDVAMTICREPVIMGNKKAARVIIALAAEDQTKHIQILNDILELFSRAEAIPALCHKETLPEVLDYISNSLETSGSN